MEWVGFDLEGGDHASALFVFFQFVEAVEEGEGIWGGKGKCVVVFFEVDVCDAFVGGECGVEEGDLMVVGG